MTYENIRSKAKLGFTLDISYNNEYHHTLTILRKYNLFFILSTQEAQNKYHTEYLFFCIHKLTRLPMFQKNNITVHYITVSRRGNCYYMLRQWRRKCPLKFKQGSNKFIMRDGNCCRLIQVSLGVYRVFQTFSWPAEFPGYHQCQQESQ